MNKQLLLDFLAWLLQERGFIIVQDNADPVYANNDEELIDQFLTEKGRY